MSMLKRPAEDSLLAVYPDRNIKLYAELAACPLYVNARIMAPGLVDNKRESFRLGWLIEDARWAHGSDLRFIPAGILTWAAPIIAAAYPSVEEAAGLTAAEVADVKAAQIAKRAKYSE